MTVAEESGRTETMDDGQGWGKGKRGEGGGAKGGAHLCSGLVGGLKLRVRKGWRAAAARTGFGAYSGGCGGSRGGRFGLKLWIKKVWKV